MLKAVNFVESLEIGIWKNPLFMSIDEIKFGDLSANDSVNSCKSGIL